MQMEYISYWENGILFIKYGKLNQWIEHCFKRLYQHANFQKIAFPESIICKEYSVTFSNKNYEQFASLIYFICTYIHKS